MAGKRGDGISERGTEPDRENRDYWVIQPHEWPPERFGRPPHESADELLLKWQVVCALRERTRLSGVGGLGPLSVSITESDDDDETWWPGHLEARRAAY